MAHPEDASEEEALHELEYDDLHHVAALPRSESSKRSRGKSEMKRIKSGGSLPKVAGAQHKLLRGHHHHHHHSSTSPHSHHRKSVKGAKQKAIAKARAFKDLDMTIELLGIDSAKHAISLLAATSMNTILADKLSAAAGVSGSMTGASPGWATPPPSAAYTPTAAAGRGSSAAGLFTASSGGSASAALSRSSSAGGGGLAVQRSSSLGAALGPGHVYAASADGTGSAEQAAQGNLPAVPEVPTAVQLPPPQRQQPLQPRQLAACCQRRQQRQQERQEVEQQQQSYVAAVKSPGGRKHRHNRSKSASVTDVERRHSQQQAQQQHTMLHSQLQQWQQHRRLQQHQQAPPRPQQHQQRQVQFAQQLQQPMHAPAVRQPLASGADGAANGRAMSAGSWAAIQHGAGLLRQRQQRRSDAAATPAFGSPFLAHAQEQQQPQQQQTQQHINYSSNSADGVSRWQPQQQQSIQQGDSVLWPGSSSSNSSRQGLPPPPPPHVGIVHRPTHPSGHLAGSSSSSTLPRGTAPGAAAAAEAGPAAVQLSASHPAEQDGFPVAYHSTAAAARSKSARAMLQSQSSPGLSTSSTGSPAAGHQGSISSAGSVPGQQSAPGQQQQSVAGQQSLQGQHSQQHLNLFRRSSPFPRKRAGYDVHSNPASAGNTGGSGVSASAVPDKALEKLQHDRAEWRSALHNVLEGQASLTPEDIESSLAESAARAEDLHPELLQQAQSVAEASSWKDREQCLGWLEDGYKRAKGITKELRSHLSLVESQGRSATFNSIINTITPAVAALAVALADNMSNALAPVNSHQQQQQHYHQLPELQEQQQAANGHYTVDCQQYCTGPLGAVQRGIAAAAAAAQASSTGQGDSTSPAQGLLSGSEEDIRLVFRVIRRWLELCKDVKDRCRTNAQQVPAVHACCNAAIDDLHSAVLRLTGATVATTAQLQGALLTPQHLGPTSFVHKVNTDSRMLILMWRYCHEMCAKVWRNFDTLRHTALLMLLELLSTAANSATQMQRTAAAAAADTAGRGAICTSRRPLYRSGSSSSCGSMTRAGSSSSIGSRSVAATSALGDISDESASDDELTVVPMGSSVWGSTPSPGIGSRGLGPQGLSGPQGTALRPLPAAADEDVQAQAWLPQMLLGLLHWSSVTARQVCEELDSAEQYSDAGLPSLASEVEEELAAALEDLQEAFFYLALINTRRVARLCSSPEGLACWALEILKDAAEGALKFVQDYDTSALGLGQVLEASGSHDQGERLFKSLKRSTDAVINGLLRVKRLLKIRRSDADTAAATPAPGFQQRQQSRQQQPPLVQQPSLQQTQVSLRLLDQQRQNGQQQRLERVLSFGAAAGPGIQQQEGRGGSSSAAFETAADGTGPGRPSSAETDIAGSSGAHVATTAAAAGSTSSWVGSPGRLVSHMPLGYSPPGALTAAAHTHAVAAHMGCDLSGAMTPPAAAAAHAAAAAMPTLTTISPAASLTRDESPPLAILGTTPSAVNMAARMSRALPVLQDLVSTADSNSSNDVAAAAAAGAAAAERWAAYKAKSGSGKFPVRAAATSQQHGAGGSSSSSSPRLLESPVAAGPTAAAAGDRKAETAAAATADKPQAVFSPFGAAAVTAAPFSPAPPVIKEQPQPAFSSGLADHKQQENSRQQQQQTVAAEASGSSFVQQSRSFKDALTAANGSAAAAGGGSSVPASGKGSRSTTPVYAASPFAPVAQQQQQQQQQQVQMEQRGSRGASPRAGSTAAADIICYVEEEPVLQTQQQPAGHASPKQQQQHVIPVLDVLPKGSAGVNPSDIALAAKLFSSTSSLLSSSKLLGSGTVTSSGLSSSIGSAAAAACSSEVTDDLAAAADALADASGSGDGVVSAAQAVLPAALAILRMIQVSDDEFWKIRWCDLEPGLLRKLGNGSYGQVFQGVYLNAQVAIKVLNIDYDDPAGLSAETLLRFKAEVDFQRKLSYHPNVVRFIGACCELPAGLANALAEAAAPPPAGQQQCVAVAGQRYVVPPGLARGVKLAIVMELCHLGSLYSMIGQARRVRSGLADGQPAADLRRAWPYGFQFQSDWLTRLEVVRGAAAGLEYMHQHGVIHRDLTSYNLLLDFGKPWQVKVCDFNLSRMVAQQQQLTNSGNPNSPGWQSPEMLSGQPYGKAADVFSFGVVLWEAITLKEPWREETEGRTALYYIMNAVTAGDRLTLPTPEELVKQGLGLEQATDLLNLTASCWCQLPVERPTMAEVASRLGGIVKAVREERRAGAAAGSRQGSAASVR